MFCPDNDVYTDDDAQSFNSDNDAKSAPKIYYENEGKVKAEPGALNSVNNAYSKPENPFLLNQLVGEIQDIEPLQDEIQIQNKKQCKPQPQRQYLIRPCKPQPQFEYLIDPNKQRIPRCNGQMLFSGSYENREITIVGEYFNTKESGNESCFASSDGKRFFVQHKHNIIYETKFIEIRGIHISNGLIKQYSYQKWGNDFNMRLWNTCLQYMSQYPNLF